MNKTLSNIFGVAIALLYFWGAGWSFYRFGALQGGVAVLFPPYGVYRGIASFWDEPEWKEKYDVRTEQLAIAIEYSVSNSRSDRSQSVEENHRLKDWINQVPPSERARLKEASRSYGLALVGCSRIFVLSLIANRIDIHPCDNSAVLQRVALFQNIPGFMASWKKMTQEMNTYAKDVASRSNNIETDTMAQERLEASQRAMNTKMNATIGEIFSEP
jgi:hypothetical protein